MVPIAQRGAHDLVVTRMKLHMVDSVAPAIMTLQLGNLSIDYLCLTLKSFGANMGTYLREDLSVSLRCESRNRLYQCLVGRIFIDVNARGWLVRYSVCGFDKCAHIPSPVRFGRPIILRHSICTVEMNSWTGRCVCSTVA